MPSGSRTIHTRWSFWNFVLTSPIVKSVGKPALKEVGGWKRTRGNAERTAASSEMPENAPKIAHPNRPKTSRRDHRPPRFALARAAFSRSSACSMRRWSAVAAFCSADAGLAIGTCSFQPRMCLGVALRCSSLAPEQRGEHAPYPEHQCDAEQHQPHGGKEQQRRKRQHSEEEAEA